MKNRKNILIIGPFPNPITGVSLANKVVKQVLDESTNFITKTINTSYPVFEDTVGRFSIKKFFFFLKINFSVLKILKSEIIYITPGQTFFGISKYALFILISSLLRKELIIHVHGNFLGTEYAQLTGIKKKIMYFLVSKFTKGIVLSESLKSNLIPFLSEEKIFILYNFAEDYLFDKSKKANKSGSIKIIYLSNLMEEKGIIYLLDALKKLEDNKIIYEAKIAGNIDKNLKKTINNKINSLKYTNYIGTVYQKEKKELLDWGNIFVLPTFYKMEGQPISILEALATQNLIISTNHAGIPDFIKDSVHGFIVEKENFNSIYKILLYLSENKNITDKICRENKMYFTNNFTVKKFCKELIKIINAAA